VNLIFRLKKIKEAAVKKWKSFHSSEGNGDDQYRKMEESTERLITVSYA